MAVSSVHGLVSQNNEGMMEAGGLVERHWFIRLAAGEAQIRCSFERLKNRIQRFTVQLEILHGEIWLPVVR